MEMMTSVARCFIATHSTPDRVAEASGSMRQNRHTLKRQMHGYDLILTITGGLGAALLFGFITQRIGLSPIVGYLIAGTLVGPNTPGIVVDAGLAEQLAEIGVILL